MGSHRSRASSKAPSYKSTSSATSYTHPLYALGLEKNASIVVTTEELEQSHFSSCSTSPNSSCESLDAFPVPSTWQSAVSSPPLTPSALSLALSALSSKRTSTASHSSSRYADEHYPLITNVTSNGKDVHSSILDMAHAYNTYIRALNSCYNHALTVYDDELPNYLFFSQTLFNILSQHMKADQRHLQPPLHRPVLHPQMAIRKTTSIFENHSYQGGFHAWANCIHNRSSQHFYSSEQLQGYISTFAPILVQHLHDEVSQLQSLVDDDILMPEHLTKIWTKFEETFSDSLDLYTDAALLVGCHDRHFTVNGQRAQQSFPRMPTGTTLIVKKWHSRRHEGVWKFCSSNFHGRRRVISG